MPRDESCLERGLCHEPITRETEEDIRPRSQTHDVVVCENADTPAELGLRQVVTATSTRDGLESVRSLAVRTGEGPEQRRVRWIRVKAQIVIEAVDSKRSSCTITRSDRACRHSLLPRQP